jgi:hypothetical protein
MMLPFRSNAKYDPTMVASRESLLSHRVCENAMMRILGKGVKFWKGCMEALDTGNKPHGNIGHTNTVKYDIHDALKVFLKQWSNMLSRS